jgi:hypothetical protein
MFGWHRLGKPLVAVCAVLVLAACSGDLIDEGAPPAICGPEVETGPTVFVDVLPLHERVASVTGCVSGLACKSQRPYPVAGPPKMRLAFFRYPFDSSVHRAVTMAHFSIRVKTAAGSRLNHDLRLVIPATRVPPGPCGPRHIPGIAMVTVEAHRVSVVYAPTDDFVQLAFRLAARRRE